MLVGPLWLLLAASALQLAPGLRGEWLFDGRTGEVEFVEYGVIAMWMRGGLVATAFLGAASPLLVMLANLSSGVGRLQSFQAAAQSSRYAGQAGTAQIDVPLTVRKRKKGRAVQAAYVRILEASSLRRLLARLTDHILLALSVGGGTLLVFFLAMFREVEFSAWLPWVVGAVFGLWMIRSQWSLLVRRGQTFGKFVFDIRVMDRVENDSPKWTRLLGLRQVVPALVTLAVAGAAAALGYAQTEAILAGLALVWEWTIIGAATLLTILVSAATNPSQSFQDATLLGGVAYVLFPLTELPGIDLEKARPVVAGGAALLAWALSEAVRTIPILFDRTALHDAVAGTRVVRSTVAEPPPQGVPPGVRLLAAGLDSLAAFAVIGLPFGVVLWFGVARPAAPLGLVLLGGCVAALGGAVFLFALQAWRIARTGATLGKSALGLQVVTSQGGAIGFSDGVMAREVFGRILLWMVLPGLGTLLDGLAALGDDRRALHDQVADCRVVWRSAAGATKVGPETTTQ